MSGEGRSGKERARYCVSGEESYKYWRHGMNGEGERGETCV